MLSTFRTLPLRGEGTHARQYKINAHFYFVLFSLIRTFAPKL